MPILRFSGTSAARPPTSTTRGATAASSQPQLTTRGSAATTGAATTTSRQCTQQTPGPVRTSVTQNGAHTSAPRPSVPRAAAPAPSQRPNATPSNAPPQAQTQSQQGGGEELEEAGHDIGDADNFGRTPRGGGRGAVHDHMKARRELYRKQVWAASPLLLSFLLGCSLSRSSPASFLDSHFL
jgi:hypothetical protein